MLSAICYICFVVSESCGSFFGVWGFCCRNVMWRRKISASFWTGSMWVTREPLLRNKGVFILFLVEQFLHNVIWSAGNHGGLCLLISLYGMEHPMSRLLPARCSHWRSHSCVVVHRCDFSAFALYKWWAVVTIQVPLSALMIPLEALFYTKSYSSSKESLCFIHKSANENVYERLNLV